MERSGRRSDHVLPAELVALTERVIGSAIEVHRTLGPGLLESAYELCLSAEFRHQGIRFARQVRVDIEYRDVMVQSGLRLDFLVEVDLVVELKAVELILPVHEAQLLSYLRLANKPLGLLMNFNVPRLRDGIRRMVNANHPAIAAYARAPNFGTPTGP